MFFDVFLNCMGEVVVNFIRVIESGLQGFFRDLPINFFCFSNLISVVLRSALLDEHFCSKFFEEFVGLSKKFFDFVVFFEFYQFEVGLHISLFEGVQTFFSLLVLDHLLLLLLQVIDALGLV